MGHQALDRTLSLLRERIYWPTMAHDASEWVKGCRRCHIAKSDYNEPKPKLGNSISNNPLDLLCIDFTKVDPSRTGKENVLVMTDAFTKFSQAIVTPNQKALTVAKVLVDNGSMSMVYQHGSIVTRESHLIMKSWIICVLSME